MTWTNDYNTTSTVVSYTSETTGQQVTPTYAFGTFPVDTDLSDSDDDYAEVTLPFTFTFYGRDYDVIDISTNGSISFDAEWGDDYDAYDFDEYCTDMVLGAHTDLDPEASDLTEISYGVVGSAPNRAYVISWHVVPNYEFNDITHDFQIVLYEGTNDVEIYNAGHPDLNGYNMTVGIASEDCEGMGPYESSSEAWFGGKWTFSSDDSNGYTMEVEATGQQVTPTYAFGTFPVDTDLSDSDDDYAEVTLPFTFTFYGRDYDVIDISTNGSISFDAEWGDDYDAYDFDEYCTDMVLGAHTDLDPEASDLTEISYGVVGSAPNRAYVISWHVVPNYDLNEITHDFQIVLYEGTNEVEIYNAGHPDLDGNNMTVGIASEDCEGMGPHENSSSPFLGGKWIFSPEESIESNVLSDECGATGEVTVTFTVTDGSNNSSSTTATFTIEDDTKPTVITQDITVDLDANGAATITTADIDNGSNDACSDVTLSLDVTSFDCDDVAQVQVVTLTATDACGNFQTATANVTVRDLIDPTITAPAAVSVSADAGACSAAASGVSLGTPAVADNCSTLVSNNAPLSFPVGQTTVTWTVVDPSGNDATATQVVTVTDDQAPVIAGMPNNISVNTAGGVCTAVVNWASPTATDNCGVTSLTPSVASGSTFDLGTTTVTYTALDAAGNSTEASFTVTVTDNQDPTITAPIDVLVNADAGACAAAASGVTLGTPTTADNCSVASVTNDAPASFPVGNTVVTWTVTDGSGRTATATQNVTVADNQFPTIAGMPSDISCQQRRRRLQRCGELDGAYV